MVRTESVNQTYVRKHEKLYRTKPASLVNAVHRFGSEEVCRDYLEKLRWPNGTICPRCNSASVSEISTRHQFDCNACRYRFSVTSGTIFDNTKLPLWKWFAAAYLMLESKKAMSANQIKRTLGSTYKTAWYLCHRIREAMETDMTDDPALFGIIEVDETILTPYRRHPGEHGRKSRGLPKGVPQVIIAGMIQRGGDMRLEVVPNKKQTTLRAFINRHARAGTEAFYTDELASYLGLADHDTRHAAVNHSDKEWVRGDVHTNSIENVWSLFKRSIIGAFHKVSVKHLDAYIQELEFRFNNRKNQFMLRDLMVRILGKEAVRYRALVA